MGQKWSFGDGVEPTPPDGRGLVRQKLPAAGADGGIENTELSLVPFGGFETGSIAGAIAPVWGKESVHEHGTCAAEGT